MKKKNLALLIVLTLVILIVVIVVWKASAAGNPVMSRVGDLQIPEGQTAEFVFVLDPDYSEIKYVFELYHPYGGSYRTDEQQINVELFHDMLTVTVDTHEHNLTEGVYSVRLYVQYNAGGKWKECPDSDWGPFTVTQKRVGWYYDSTHGAWQYCDSDGVPATGWVYVDNVWYYFNGDGYMHTGWLQIGSDWYYCNPSGEMATGTVTVDGKQHQFNTSGVWQGEVTQNDEAQESDDGAQGSDGWVQESGNWYYIKDDAKVTGWLYTSNRWYYLDGSGIMQTGWVKVNNEWFYFNNGGVMVTGWLQLGDTWYYLDKSGAMVTGTATIEGRQYQFDDAGAWVP